MSPGDHRDNAQGLRRVERLTASQEGAVRHPPEAVSCQVMCFDPLLLGDGIMNVQKATRD